MVFGGGGISGLRENGGEWGRNGAQAGDYWIKIYKNITNEYWLRPIMKEDVFNFNSILVRKTPKNSAGSRHSETAYWTRGFSRSSKNNLNIQYKNIRP